VIGGGLLVGLYVIMMAFTDATNTLGALAKYMAAISFILGVIAGRWAAYYLIFLSAFSDFFKRLLIEYGNPSLVDVSLVLGMAPLTCAGMFVAALLTTLVHFGERGRRDLPLILLTLIIGLMVLMYAVNSTTTMFGFLRTAANSATYVTLLVSIPRLFPSLADIKSLLMAIVWIYTLVAIYGIWQKAFGLAEFEIAYFESGLTTEVVRYYRYLQTGVLQVFSSLNSPRTLSAVMASCCACLIFFGYYRKNWRFRGVFHIGILLAMGMFITCMVLTIARGGWLTFAVIFVSLVAFKYRVTTLAVYGSAVMGVVLLYTFSTTLLQNWDRYSSFQAESQAFRISTFSQRLLGFHNLRTNPDAWTLFGVPAEDRESAGGTDVSGLDRSYGYLAKSKYFSHDALTKSIINYGIIPTGLVVLLVAVLLWRMHSYVFRARSREMRTALRVLLALLFGNLAGGLTTSNFIAVFPINVFVWLFLASLISVVRLSILEIELVGRAERAERVRPKLDQPLPGPVEGLQQGPSI